MEGRKALAGRLFEAIMQQKISNEALSKQAGHFTMGFARLTQGDKGEEATSAGSGTLVIVGSLHGVLTAAHVVEELPKHGSVGIILSAESPAHYQKLAVNMGRAESPVVIKGKEFGPLGPDLAFLRLPDDEALGWLKAQNSFYNLDKRRDDVLSGKEPAGPSADCITGIIHELTEEVPSERRGVRRVNFSTLFCPVRPSDVKYPDTSDLVCVELNTEHEPSFKSPDSFEGMSGARGDFM
jgi:hypothetical protein